MAMYDVREQQVWDKFIEHLLSCPTCDFDAAARDMAIRDGLYCFIGELRYLAWSQADRRMRANHRRINGA